jgi:hypothetical protein
MGTSSSTRRRILTNYGCPVILLGRVIYLTHFQLLYD